jgi:hypothetical protein
MITILNLYRLEQDQTIVLEGPLKVSIILLIVSRIREMAERLRRAHPGGTDQTMEYLRRQSHEIDIPRRVEILQKASKTLQ